MKADIALVDTLGGVREAPCTSWLYKTEVGRGSVKEI